MHPAAQAPSGVTGSPAIRAVFAAKTARTFCYGFLGVMLPVYLSDLGMSSTDVGVAVTLMLVGSAALTWAIRGPTERYGAGPTLLGLAALSALSAIVLLSSANGWLVVVAAAIGNVAVGTGETGPFLTIEQVVVARAASPERRTAILSVYNVLGYGAAALGAATVGLVPVYRLLFFVFLVGAGLQALAYMRLPTTSRMTRHSPIGARPSAKIIRALAALFALDSFAGGFVLQSLVAYYLHVRYGMTLEALGVVFFGVQIVTATSLLLAAPAAARFGLLNTMVVSHVISNLVLIAIAVAPNAMVAVGLLLIRHLLSQMDVPTRQAYVMAIVGDSEREAAATATNLARTMSQAVSPAITGWVMQTLAFSAPFVLGGGLKILYDVLLYLRFRNVALSPEGG